MAVLEPAGQEILLRELGVVLHALDHVVPLLGNVVEVVVLRVQVSILVRQVVCVLFLLLECFGVLFSLEVVLDLVLLRPVAFEHLAVVVRPVLFLGVVVDGFREVCFIDLPLFGYAAFDCIVVGLLDPIQQDRVLEVVGRVIRVHHSVSFEFI